MERRHSIIDDSQRHERRNSIKTTILKQFCCYCIDLRVGCIIIGIINVLEGLSTFGTAYYHSFTWNIGLCASTTTVAGLLLVFAAVRNNYIAQQHL